MMMMIMIMMIIYTHIHKSIKWGMTIFHHFRSNLELIGPQASDESASVGLATMKAGRIAPVSCDVFRWYPYLINVMYQYQVNWDHCLMSTRTQVVGFWGKLFENHWCLPQLFPSGFGWTNLRLVACWMTPLGIHRYDRGRSAYRTAEGFPFATWIDVPFDATLVVREKNKAALTQKNDAFVLKQEIVVSVFLQTLKWHLSVVEGSILRSVKYGLICNVSLMRGQ